MINYNLPTYDKYHDWIRLARSKGMTWESIKYAGLSSEDELKRFLIDQGPSNFWEITCEDWYAIVSTQQKMENRTIRIRFDWEKGIIKSEKADNETTVPTEPYSSWQLYRKKLLEEKGFRTDVVDSLEDSVHRILKRLSTFTEQDKPIKGLVVGNVQSGKTANMAGLMAMAADWGWNMFVILSGTIESLRVQTENRIFSDLHNVWGNLSWHILNKPSQVSGVGERAQDMNFRDDSHERYFTVCLKNSTRLKGLIKWMQNDKNQQSNMRVLVIDDEADQASIDTLNISLDEKNAINKLITNLVNGYEAENDKKKSEIKFFGMNYVGYTATPYANVLNDSKPESLYPHDFIASLGVSNEYFGPQQIFGVDGGKYNGLNIVNEVTADDLKIIKEIHDGLITDLPESLEEAICWFCCGVAALRYQGYHKPISMLVHTSQKTDHHKNIGDAILRWFKNTDKKKIIEQCRKTWKAQIEQLSIDKFYENYPDYGKIEDGEDITVRDYPDFSDIEGELDYLISEFPAPILMEDDRQLIYHEHIHFCIDNCRFNRPNGEGEHLRLAYPDSTSIPAKAPAFIVIGGATLARGLTIEGLISTYFLRSVGQADTLMQMGRWFGYRRNYELLPRIWITNNTNKQFKFLSNLDQELRDEIISMGIRNVSPDDYGPKVKNTPNYKLIRITSKNKMQSAQLTDMDYSGSFNQTYLFDTDERLLSENLKTVSAFIEELGEPVSFEGNQYSKQAAVWKGVRFERVKKLIGDYHFYDALPFVKNLESYIDWLSGITADNKLGDWSVIVSGGGKDNIRNERTLNLKNCTVNKVSRTRKNVKGTDRPDPNMIDIGVLSDPRDFLSDIDLEDEKVRSSSDLMRLFVDFASKGARQLRNAAMETTPQLIIYIVDRFSKSPRSSQSRSDLSALADIAGLCFNIPGGKKGENYAMTLSVKLTRPEEFADDGDIEDADGN